MGVSSKSEVCGNLCQCKVNYNNSNSDKVTSDNLFSPIKNKMKVLKKIKKRMGLGRFFISFFIYFLRSHVGFFALRKIPRVRAKFFSHSGLLHLAAFYFGNHAKLILDFFYLLHE